MIKCMAVLVLCLLVFSACKPADSMNGGSKGTGSGDEGTQPPVMGGRESGSEAGSGTTESEKETEAGAGTVGAAGDKANFEAFLLESTCKKMTGKLQSLEAELAVQKKYGYTSADVRDRMTKYSDVVANIGTKIGECFTKDFS